MAHGRLHIPLTDLLNPNLNTDSVPLDDLQMLLRQLGHLLSDEDIKNRSEWGNEDIGIKHCFELLEDKIEGMEYEFGFQEPEEPFYKEKTSSNDADLKPMAHEMYIPLEDLLNPNLNTDLVPLDDFQMLIRKLWQGLSDEDIKNCSEWANEGIEGMGQTFCCDSCSIEYEETFYKNQTLSGTFASAIGVRSAELEQPIQSEDEGYEIDDPDVHSLSSFSDEESEFCALDGWL